MAELNTFEKMYYNLVLLKRFNQRFVDLKAQRKVSGPIHQTEGQEAAGVGVCAALRPDDYVVTYYRGMAEWLSKGMDPKKLAAELLGKEPGLCHGRGGEMTLADVSVGVMLSSGIIGGNISPGVGVALAAKKRRQGQVVAIFFGDGATNTGEFHEGLNMAAVLKVPAVFVCLNNQFAISTFIGNSSAARNVVDRAAAYNMPGYLVDGNELIAVYEAATKAVATARTGGGPSLIEAKTYRIGGHSSSNPETYYMPETDLWRARDPLPIYRKHLLERRMITVEELRSLDERATRVADEAVDYAVAAPLPPPETAATGVFV